VSLKLKKEIIDRKDKENLVLSCFNDQIKSISHSQIIIKLRITLLLDKFASASYFHKVIYWQEI
jgi:hypothetical protein